MAHVKTGLEVFADTPMRSLRNQRLGLLCNPASVDCRLRHAREIIRAALPGQLTTLFSPQHGFHAEKQDNMIESDHDVDPISGLPVFSLYGETRIPNRAMFDGIDVLLVDLQDVGTRVYTFMYTLSYCMEAARAYGKRVVVLDRPNPVGGLHIEGNLLVDDYASFVGRYPIPMRHGLTMGELAILFNTQFGIGCDLTVVAMQGWKRSMMFAQTGLPWVPPSPNLPTPASALVYPGQVIFEGTNISEGRGTTQPFELFGAPFIDTARIGECIDASLLAGVILRPAAFEPTSNKWCGQRCQGFQIHVTDPTVYSAYPLSLSLCQAIRRCHRGAFAYKQPPYEYEYQRLPLDLILGDRTVRKHLEEGASVAALAAAWAPQLNAYRERIEALLLYR
jgi:uncharacterized protein YbbC (DUF1343 family)